jgi:HD-GYP domain-containing protein (c-di-GMP phosphodiesterase class II)/DNA-binding response OmpR family regulator
MKTVLLAYEREQDLAAVETILQARGHRVLKAKSGVEALEAIRVEPLDAVVSDVQLPRLDGFALCRRLREDPAYMQLPFVLHSFRVGGPKYEAFAAEVGAQRFLPRGATLEELAAIVDETPGRSGTMRMPALVPELLDRREQDRRRVAELERQLREAEAAKAQLAAAERVARDRAEHEARARSEFAAAESVRIRELQLRIRELEAASRQAAEAEAAVRDQMAETRTGLARVVTLEARVAELQTLRARAQTAANDAERVFAAQPLPTWIIDAESRLVHAASDSAGELVGAEPSSMRGRPLNEAFGSLEFFADDALRDATVSWRRADGSTRKLELRRVTTSYAGRTCWVMTARDVTADADLRAKLDGLDLHAQALDAAPGACALIDPEGNVQHANRAMLDLLGVDLATCRGLALGSLDVQADDDATLREVPAPGHGVLRHEATWRRPDGELLGVELAGVPFGANGYRVVTVRDVSAERRFAERNERDRERVVRLLELVQRSHALTESELLDRAAELAQSLTRSPVACVFLGGADPVAPLEVAARRGGAETDTSLSLLTRWHGVPPADSAVAECIASQRPVVRDASEGTGVLKQAGLPSTLSRQVATPIVEGGKLFGAMLVADGATPYDDDDRRHVAHIADTIARLLRRRRADAEVMSSMDHMERMMLGAIESLAQLAEAQDACKLGRSRRVADYAVAIGNSMGLPPATVRGLRVMGQLIDVGMLQIPRELLWRPGPLAPAEYELIKTHAERGYEALRGIEFPWPVADVVRQHHERLDGSGYPRGLKGEEILLEARIVAVADAVEAMLAQRPHRAPLSVGACIEELQSQAGRRYDARAVKACVKLLREGHGSAQAVNQPEGETATAGQRIA